MPKLSGLICFLSHRILRHRGVTYWNLCTRIAAPRIKSWHTSVIEVACFSCDLNTWVSHSDAGTLRTFAGVFVITKLTHGLLSDMRHCPTMRHSTLHYAIVRIQPSRTDTHLNTNTRGFLQCLTLRTDKHLSHLQSKHWLHWKKIDYKSDTSHLYPSHKWQFRRLQVIT